MQFRKKPVVIEAMQFTMDNKDQVLSWAKGIQMNVMPTRDEAGEPAISIPTLDGTMKAVNGDWVVKGVKGELYPCKPDIFEATYEAVANEA